MTTASKAELASLIADAALLRGTFTLRSGRTSSYYLDKYLFTTKPDVLRQLGLMFSEVIDGLDVKPDRLAGAELGGIPLVTVASMATGLPCVFVRNAKKDYGTAKQTEGKIETGDKLVLLEDVATSGGQAVEAVNTLRELGAAVLAVIATIDREEGARENVEASGTAFFSLFTKSDLGIDE